jgi:hypothetical protein
MGQRLGRRWRLRQIGGAAQRSENVTYRLATWHAIAFMPVENLALFPQMMEFAMKYFIAAAAAAACLAATASAFAQSALPKGVYSISGAFTHFSGADCTISAKSPVSGTLLYPGVGQSTTELVLDSADAKSGSALQLFTAFPPVPAAGLNGWTAAAPATPNFATYANGQGEQGGAAAQVSFVVTNIFSSYVAPTQGTITVAAGGCTESLAATLVRTGAFLKSK